MSRFAAILSGGVGERFWPASTPGRPKQLLALLGRRTMLRETVERLSPLLPSEQILIVTSADLVAATIAECPELPPENVVGEPRRRNTAAAVGIAACAALVRGGEGAALAVLPADHAVKDGEAFRSTLGRAFALAEMQPLIVTLGIRPDRAEMGYGYMTTGEPAAGGAFQIAAFHEKPESARARELVDAGGSYWNAGMFIARARTLLREIALHAPELGALLEPVLAAAATAPGDRGTPSDALRRLVGTPAFRELYERAPAISFDHAVMERTAAGVVLPADVGWDDVGSWESMTRLLERDAGGNVVRGEGRVAHGRDNILFAEGGRITLIGAANLLVVRAGDEILVCSRERLPEIRDILRELNGHAG